MKRTLKKQNKRTKNTTDRNTELLLALIKEKGRCTTLDITIGLMPCKSCVLGNNFCSTRANTGRPPEEDVVSRAKDLLVYNLKKEK